MKTSRASALQLSTKRIAPNSSGLAVLHCRVGQRSRTSSKGKYPHATIFSPIASAQPVDVPSSAVPPDLEAKFHRRIMLLTTMLHARKHRQSARLDSLSFPRRGSGSGTTHALTATAGLFYLPLAPHSQKCSQMWSFPQAPVADSTPHPRSFGSPGLRSIVFENDRPHAGFSQSRTHKIVGNVKSHNLLARGNVALATTSQNLASGRR